MTGTGDCELAPSQGEEASGQPLEPRGYLAAGGLALTEPCGSYGPDRH